VLKAVPRELRGVRVFLVRNRHHRDSVAAISARITAWLRRRLAVSIHPDNEEATGFIRRRDWAENAAIAPNLINLWKNQIA
jgi:hypothetical protein